MHLLAVDKLLMHQHTVTHIEAHGGAAGKADARTAVVVSALRCARLGCHGTLYVPNARGWYAYPVRTVRGALGQAALRLRYVPNAGGWYA